MSNAVIWLVIAVVVCLFILTIWRWHVVAMGLKYIARDEMPIWLSLVLAISAGLGTYYLAPIINESFEFQKNRSTHLISTIEEMNKSVVALSVASRKFNDALFYKQKDVVNRRGAVLDQIAELQWRLVDASVIIRRVYPKDTTTFKLSTELMKLQRAVVSAQKPEDQESVADAHVAVTKAAESCMVTLYTAANLN